jgi:tetraacyldisaccharide 4'-kinase
MDSAAVHGIVEKFLTRGRDRWYHLPTLALLFPLEQLYRLGWKIRERPFSSGKAKTFHPGVPVVCVGSLCAGGSGKTPLTVLVAQRLAARGKRVAVISRGYGNAGSAEPQIIRPGTARGDRLRLISSQAGDEPAMIARALPDIAVVVCPDRSAAAETAVEDCGAEVLVLDDGFGHRRLERDLDILVFSGGQIMGQAHTFPAGFFREPAQAASRAGAFAVTGSLLNSYDRPGNPPTLPDWAEGKPLIRMERRVRGVVRLDRWLEHGAHECDDANQVLRGKHVIAFCALANPGAFRDQIAGCGPESLAACAWADHHRYSGGDQGRLREQAAREGALLVTTEKDAVKLDPELIGGETLVVCLELVERDPAVLDGLLDSLL